ncbi:S-adenosyl-L-methionine-dependent methyltransferase [Aspergillus ambiguus]|uniref:class I SAM-dependent methyltransferase n=1 Tax=Aspergillus ambiguus TaxID=176160 RepID=UPI003CCD66E2
MTNHSIQIKGDVKKFYDQNASLYLESTQHPFELRLHYFRKLVARLPAANASILELGCGAGVPCTQFLAQHERLKIVANDISETQIVLARKRLPPSVKLLHGDMTGLQFPPNTFDAVSAIYTVFHLPRDEQIIMLQRIYDWLKSGGFLLVTFSPHEVIGEYATSYLGGAATRLFWSGWGPEKTREILMEIGFHLELDEIMADMEAGRDGRVESPYHWVLARKL